MSMKMYANGALAINIIALLHFSHGNEEKAVVARLYGQAALSK